jgi:P27 family predicted phage terminase small subunit
VKTGPPENLSTEMTQWWRQVVRAWKLSAHHLRVLQAAAESWDRMVEAREVLEKEGLVVTDRFGQKKQHPAFGIERDSRLSFVRCVRELALSDEQLPDTRPPRLSGRYAGRK